MRTLMVFIMIMGRPPRASHRIGGSEDLAREAAELGAGEPRSWEAPPRLRWAAPGAEEEYKLSIIFSGRATKQTFHALVRRVLSLGLVALFVPAQPPDANREALSIIEKLISVRGRSRRDAPDGHLFPPELSSAAFGVAAQPSEWITTMASEWISRECSEWEGTVETRANHGRRRGAERRETQFAFPSTGASYKASAARGTARLGSRSSRAALRLRTRRPFLKAA